MTETIKTKLFSFSKKAVKKFSMEEIAEGLGLQKVQTLRILSRQ